MMSDYGKGAVLGTAVTLPATTSAVLMASRANSTLVMGMLVVSAIMFVVSVGMMVRYAVNRKRNA